jgi:hypothetical protein
MRALYNQGWRNRSYTFYTQFCYEDELEPKLRALLQQHGSAFDDEWQYLYPIKKKVEARRTVVRRPLWQDGDERFGVIQGKNFRARETTIIDARPEE